MGRKERCPRCGSKKITINANQKECKVCKHTWTGRLGGKTSKKESPILDEKNKNLIPQIIFIDQNVEG